MPKTKLCLALLLCFSSLSFAQNGGKSDGIVATVDNDIILKSELQDAVDALAQQYQAQNQTVSNATLTHQALDALIARKLQLAIVKRAGVQANDAVINRQLLAIANQNGFANLSDFAQAMEKQQAGSYAALRGDLIDNAAIEALWQHQLNSRVRISDQEIDAFLASSEGQALRQDRYRLLHARIPYLNDEDAAKQDALRLADGLRQALNKVAESGRNPLIAIESAQENYAAPIQAVDTDYIVLNAIPSQARQAVLSLDVGEVADPLQNSAGVDVLMLLDKRESGKIELPEWEVSHILARTDDVQTPAIAEQKINDIYRAIQQGANFADLAATYSDDTASASAQGSLGWVGEDQMVAEFERVMKNTNKGDYSTPFRTQFGYHILKVNDVRKRDVSDQYYRAQAQKILTDRLGAQAQEDWIQELKAAAYIDIKAPN